MRLLQVLGRMLSLAAVLLVLSFPKIISGHSDGAARTRLEWQQFRQTAGPPDLAAHPCPAPYGCGPHCSRPHKTRESVAGALRRRPAPGPGTRAAQCQSGALHIGILPWGSWRDRSVADSHCPHSGREDMSVGAIIVAHQVGWS